LAIGLAAYVRSANLLMIPAIVVSRLWISVSGEGGLRNAWNASKLAGLLAAALVAWLVLLPWSIYKEGRVAQPPADQTRTYDYVTGMLHRDARAPSSPRLPVREILGRSDLRSRQIASVLGSRMHEEAAGDREPADTRLGLHGCYTFVLLALLCISTVRRRMPAELFCLATLASISIYFGFRERLLLPVYVISMFAAARVISDFLARRVGIRLAAILTSVLVLIMAVVDAAPRVNWARIEQAYLADTERFKALEAAIDEDARVGTYNQQHVISVYLERDVPTMKIVVRRDGPAAVESLIDKYRLNTIVMPDTRSIGVDTQATLTYMRANYGAGVAVGAARFWRVRP
jgi:cytochrome c oxidase subunit IV